MKHILINRDHDITAFASSDESRFILQGVHYDPGKKVLEATDGRKIIRVPVVVDEHEAFPPVGDDKHMAEECVIPTAAFKKALGNIPKLGVSIVCNAVLSKNCAPNSVILTTNDLATQLDIKTKCIEGVYPNTQQVIPEKEPILSITISACHLEAIVDYAKRHALERSGNAIKFGFWTSTEPCTFSIQTNSGEAYGVLMPMRSEDAMPLKGFKVDVEVTLPEGTTAEQAGIDPANLGKHGYDVEADHAQEAGQKALGRFHGAVAIGVPDAVSITCRVYQHVHDAPVR